MNVLGSSTYSSSIHPSTQANSPSSYLQYNSQGLLSSASSQSQNNQQLQQNQQYGSNNFSSSQNNSKRQAGRAQQQLSSSQGLGSSSDGEERIRQKYQTLSLSQQSKSYLFKQQQQQQYFKSDKYKKLQKIFRQKLHQNLYDKFSQSQNYYYTRDLNDLLQGSRTKFTIKFKDYLVFDEREEYLKRMYSRFEYPQKIKLLTEYYKFHQDIPRLFMQPLCNSINHMHDKKRRIEFYRIAKIIDDENKKNPDKPPKGIVGDIPAPGTEESIPDKNNQKGKQKVEQGLSNFLKDLSSFVNIGSGESKMNIDNNQLTKSKIIKKNIGKYSSQGSLKLGQNGITQPISKQKQTTVPTNNQQKQASQETQRNKSNTNTQNTQSNRPNSNSSSTSLQQSQRGGQDTLLEINFKLNDILQQSSMSIKSEVTINDMADNHGLEDFLKFLSKEQNIHLMSRTTRNSIKPTESNSNQQQIKINSNDIKIGNSNQVNNNNTNQIGNFPTSVKNGGTINLQSVSKKTDSKDNNTNTRSANSKDESKLKNELLNDPKKLQAKQNSDQNSFSDSKKQISENFSNSTKASQQNLDKVYSSSKNQVIIQQKISEQLQQQQQQQQQIIEEPFLNQQQQSNPKNLKISLHGSSLPQPALSSARNSQGGSSISNHHLDLKLNLNSIQNNLIGSNVLTPSAQSSNKKSTFQQGKRLSTGGATLVSESQKTLLSHRVNKADMQLDDYPLTSRASLNSGGSQFQLQQEFLTQQMKPIATMRGQINSPNLNINVNFSQQPIPSQQIAQINFSSQNQLLSDSLTKSNTPNLPLSSDHKISLSQPIFQKTFSGNMNNNSSQGSNPGSSHNIQPNNNTPHSLTQSQFKISKVKKSTNNPSSQKVIEISPRGDSREDPDSCLGFTASLQAPNQQQVRISKVKNQSISSRNQFSSMHAKPISQLNSPSNSVRSFNPSFNFNTNTSGGGQDTIGATASSPTSSNNFQSALNNQSQQSNQNQQIDSIVNGKLNPSNQQKIINQIQNIDQLSRQFQFPQQMQQQQSQYQQQQLQNNKQNALQQQQQQLQVKLLANQNIQKIKSVSSIKQNEPILTQSNMLIDGYQSNQNGKSQQNQQGIAPFNFKSTTSRESTGGQGGIKSQSQINTGNGHLTGSLTQRGSVQQTHFRQHSNPIQNNLLTSPNSLLNQQNNSTNISNGNNNSNANNNNNLMNGNNNNLPFTPQNTTGFNYFSSPNSNNNINSISAHKQLLGDHQNGNQLFPQNDEYFQRNSSIINHPSIQNSYKETPLISPRMDGNNQKQFFGQNTQLMQVNNNQQQIQNQQQQQQQQQQLQKKQQSHKYTKSDQQQNNYNYLQQFQSQNSNIGSPSSNPQAKMLKINTNANQQHPSTFLQQQNSNNQVNNGGSMSNFNFKTFDQAALSSQLTSNNTGGYTQSSKLQTARQSITKLPAAHNAFTSQQNTPMASNSQSIKIKSISPRKQLVIPINNNMDSKKFTFQ